MCQEMSHRRCVLTAVLTLATIVMTAGIEPVYADIINGGFETGDLTGWQTYADAGGSVSVINSTEAPEGTHYAILSLDPPGTPPFDGAFAQLILSQNITAAAGQTVQLDVRSAGTTNAGGFEIDMWDVHGGGYTSLIIPSNGTGSMGDWTSVTVPFTDSLAPAHLRIMLDEHPVNGAWYPQQVAVDAIFLVPEPSTLVLLGVGAIGLLVYARRRR